MRAIENVAGIDSIGGYEKQYVIEPDPAKLAAFGVSFAELAQALESANLSVGANFLQSGRGVLPDPRGRARTHP
jgi:heavy metal efflux system protein